MTINIVSLFILGFLCSTVCLNSHFSNTWIVQFLGQRLFFWLSVGTAPSTVRFWSITMAQRCYKNINKIKYSKVIQSIIKVTQISEAPARSHNHKTNLPPLWPRQDYVHQIHNWFLCCCLKNKRLSLGPLYRPPHTTTRSTGWPPFWTV